VSKVVTNNLQYTPDVIQDLSQLPTLKDDIQTAIGQAVVFDGRKRKKMADGFAPAA